jgi:hypothetical protein
MRKVDGWITFTGPNVLAVRRRDKTETRQVMKTQPLGEVKSAVLWGDGLWRIEHQPVAAPVGEYVGLRIRCPHKVGDILGVKEGYQILHDIPRSGFVTGEYLADGAHFEVELSKAEWDKWTARKFPYRATSGRFMYKSLARTFAEVLEVRVERLREISRASIDAEGTPMMPGQMSYRNDYYQRLKDFGYFWDSINAKKDHGWNANPAVWVYRLEVVE